jgi:hypothetical protein
MQWARCAKSRTAYQEQIMQQRQKAVPPPSKPRQPVQAKGTKTTPIAVDEKALRQIAGGLMSGPNGGW